MRAAVLNKTYSDCRFRYVPWKYTIFCSIFLKYKFTDWTDWKGDTQVDMCENEKNMAKMMQSLQLQGVWNDGTVNIDDDNLYLTLWNHKYKNIWHKPKHSETQQGIHVVENKLNCNSVHTRIISTCEHSNLCLVRVSKWFF